MRIAPRRRIRPRTLVAVALTAAALGMGAPRAARAQIAAPLYVPLRTAAEWRTLETPGFAFHYPAELEAWTRRQAERMESVRASARGLVGYAPTRRVTVLVADPYNVANGSAYPFLDAPGIFLWPVPPDPRSMIGDSRDWGELLVVHEYAHLAHLTRPSRNPLRRLAGRVIPAMISPVAANSPRWLFEGYATYVEGRLTGSGRPHSAWRPAVLRQWALEGRLPTYWQLDATGGFLGGSFAYLAGSAYLEWLVDRYAGARGDSVLAHLWRRMTARTPRALDAAFSGVFPGTPAELYARWSAEVTAEAVAQQRRLQAAGLVDGALVQRLSGFTGDPAVSPDGRLVAVDLRPTGGTPRIVVWRTTPDPPDTTRAGRAAARRAAAQREAQRRRDPEDVPAIPYLPPPRRALATLPAVNGRAFASPRFMPDGRHLLVERDEPRPDGTSRPDLWLWDRTGSGLRRLTHGAAVRDADPAPDGRSALATRCLAGTCEVVRVDLATGAASTVLAGTPEVSYARPRWAPDGRRFVVAEHRGGRWRLLVAGADGEDARAVGDDRDDRYDAAFLPGEDVLVAVSERGGVPNLARIDLATGESRPLTRVTGAAVAPAPIPGTRALLFLSLHARGLDLRRLALDSVAPTPSLAVVPLTTAAVDTAGAESLARTAVVARPPERAAPLPAAPIGASRGYGLGPRRYVLLPAPLASADGVSALALLGSADPVGRLTWVLLGGFGNATAWHGGSLSVAWRGLPPVVEAQAFGVSQRVDPPGDATPYDIAPGEFRDRLRYWGGTLGLVASRAFSAASIRARAAGSVGTLNTELGGSVDRRLALAELRGAIARGRGRRLATLGLGAHVATGETADSAFTRVVGSASLALRSSLGAARGEYVRAHVGRDAPAFEQLFVGGLESPIVDAGVLSQRLAMPALPTGFVSGRDVETARVTLAVASLEPYWWVGHSRDAATSWKRVLGVERSFASGAIPFARVPGTRIVAGVGYSIDPPLRHEIRGYVSVVVRP